MQNGHERVAAEPQLHLRNRTSTALLAALFAAAVLLPLLGHRPLTDWDEGIYAEIAREMLCAHTLQGFLAPHWNGHLWFEKPPLQMWLTAASLRLFGLNAFAARLPSALAGIATVTLLHAWLLRRVNALTAWLSTVILLSAFGFQHVARVGETDTLLALFCLLATLGLAELLKNRPLGWILFWTGFALALLTKGAGSLPLPLTALLLTLLNPRQLLRHARSFALGAALFLALTLPWHIYAYIHFGDTFLSPYLGLHVLHRATAAIEGHITHPWFYLWVLFISAPLFSLLYPAALTATFRRPDLSLLRPLALFALVELVLFSAARTRLPHYIAPAYPPLAAITAAWLASRFAALGQPSRSLGWQLALVAVVLYAALAALTDRPRRALHAPELLNGYTTPDNRESVALLQQLKRLQQTLPEGPLLVWRQSPVVPLTTDAFYARRLAQQVALVPPPPDLPLDPYDNQPHPLTDFLNTRQLLLLDRALIPQLPGGMTLIPLATGKSQQLVILVPAP